MKKIFFFIYTLLPCLLLAEEQVYSSPAVMDSVAVVKTMFKSFMIVLILIIALFFWYRYFLPRMKVSNLVSKNMKIIEKLYIDPTTMLYLIQVGDSYQIIASSNKNVTVISTFKKDELNLKIVAEQNTAQNIPFSNYFKAFLKKGNLKIEDKKD